MNDVFGHTDFSRLYIVLWTIKSKRLRKFRGENVISGSYVEQAHIINEITSAESVTSDTESDIRSESYLGYQNEAVA